MSRIALAMAQTPRAPRGSKGPKAPRNGAAVYRGPSLLNGKPIVAVVTGLRRKSDNPKTGDMVQVFILPANVAPARALSTGADAAMCGDYPHRPAAGGGAGTCYVNVALAPQAVWRARYRKAPPQRVAPLLAGRVVRLGAWGDPAAVPADVWEQLLSHAKELFQKSLWRILQQILASCR